MTKLEALAKDCIENHTHRLIDKPSEQDIYTREESIYISGYKECERQNKNKIKQLEAQIEKMKCCSNCKHYNGGYLKCICKEPSYSCNRIFKGGTKDLWELRK